jgi:cytochrome c biogenesis protein CcdA
MWLKRIAGVYLIFVGLIFLFERNFFGLANKNPYDYWRSESLAHFFSTYYQIVAPILGIIVIIVGLVVILTTVKIKRK